MTFRQPPEWALHDWVRIGFPSHADLWEDDLEPARAEVITFARPIHADGKGERVRLVADDPDSVDRARELAGPDIEIVQEIFGDIWLRDTAPLILKSGGERAAADFAFNGWGGKYELEGDDTIGLRLAETMDLEATHPDWLLAGSAIAVARTGRAIQTEQSTLPPNHNNSLIKHELND